jgi:hypothetical protein
MNTHVEAVTTQQTRRELLMVLKVVYPVALSVGVLYRSLLGAFPLMEWEYLRRDLAYLEEKGHVTWRPSPACDLVGMPEWRRRVYRLSPAGVERADRRAAERPLEVGT